jgi:undecaprenyl-diphosphatase
MDSIITFCGKYLIALSVVITAYLFYRINKKDRNKFLLQLVIGGLLAIVLARIATHLYSNPRPFVSDGVTAVFNSSTNNGFPSDHTLLASFLGFSALIYSRKIGAILLIVAALVAWGRVAGGVHHGVDVLASFVIAGISAYVTHKFIVPRVGKKETKKHQPAAEDSSNSH